MEMKISFNCQENEFENKMEREGGRLREREKGRERQQKEREEERKNNFSVDFHGEHFLFSGTSKN